MDKCDADKCDNRVEPAPKTSEPDINDGGQYWRMRYEQLKNDFDHVHKLNQNLEDKLLNVVETFEKERNDLVTKVEYEKSTLMADVNKLSTRLVDARIKLLDYEEKEILHAAECGAPCHKSPAPSQPYPAYSSSFKSTSKIASQSNDKNLTKLQSISRNSNNNGHTDQQNQQQIAQQMANDPNLV